MTEIYYGPVVTGKEQVSDPYHPKYPDAGKYTPKREGYVEKPVSNSDQLGEVDRSDG